MANSITPQTPQAPIASIKLDATLPAATQDKNQIAQDIVDNKVQFQDERGNRWYYTQSPDESYQKVFLKNQDSLGSIILETNHQSTINNVIADINKYINNENISQHFFSHSFNGFLDKINSSNLNLSINPATTSWIMKKSNANQFSIEERVFIDGIAHKKLPASSDETPGIAAEAKRKIELSLDNTGQTKVTTQEAVMHVFKKSDYYQFLAATDKATLNREFKSTIQPQIQGLVTTVLQNKPTLLDTVQDFFSRYLPFVPPSTKVVNYNQAHQERNFLAGLREIAQNSSSQDSHLSVLKNMQSAGVEIAKTAEMPEAVNNEVTLETSITESSNMIPAEELVQNILSDLKTTVVEMRENIGDKTELKEQLAALFENTLPGDSFNAIRADTLAQYDEANMWAWTQMQLEKLCDKDYAAVAKIPAALEAFQSQLQEQQGAGQSPPTPSPGR